MVLKWKVMKCLQGKQNQESDHKTEKSHSFRQGKSKDSIWEKLLFQRWISGVSDDQTSKNGSNPSSWTSNANGSSSGTNEFCSGVDVSLNWRGLNRTGDNSCSSWSQRVEASGQSWGGWDDSSAVHDDGLIRWLSGKSQLKLSTQYEIQYIVTYKTGSSRPRRKKNNKSYQLGFRKSLFFLQEL